MANYFFYVEIFISFILLQLVFIFVFLKINNAVIKFF